MLVSSQHDLGHSAGKKKHMPIHMRKTGSASENLFHQQSPLLQEGNSTLYYVMRGHISSLAEMPQSTLGTSLSQVNRRTVDMFCGQMNPCISLLWDRTNTKSHLSILKNATQGSKVNVKK